MQIRYNCPTHNCVAIIEYEPLEGVGDSITCPRCSTPHAIRCSESLRNTHTVDQCAVCGCKELFIRKDFPQRIGVAVVILAGLASIYFFRSNFLLSYAILAAAILVDLILYLSIGRLTVCYACRAEYRKCTFNPAHEGFDLATSEKY